MKKTLAAVTAGALLVAAAWPATSATSPGVARVGDRVGAQADASSEFRGIPVIGLLAIAGVLAATIVVLTGDDSDSD